MRCALMLVALAATATAAPSAADCQTASADSPVPLIWPGGYLHTIKSKVNGRTYVFGVIVPTLYLNRGPRDTTHYPTLYLTDGDISLPIVTGVRKFAPRATQDSEPATNPILVGIFWREGGSREFNYTPPLMRDTGTNNERLPDGSRKFGGAAEFLRVLKEEIIPLVDRTYRTSTDRGLYGISFGGLFATYALFKEPDLFTRYAIASPSLWWDRNAIFELEAPFAKAHPTLDKVIYLSASSEESSTMIGGTWQLMRQMCDSYDDNGNYKGLRILAETVHGESHSSPVPLWRALQALYWPPGRNVPQPRDIKTC